MRWMIALKAAMQRIAILTPNVPIYLLVAALSPFIASCGEPEFPRGKYPVIDSGVWVADVDSRAFVWLDNQRIVFISSNSFKHDADESHHVLALWQVGAPPQIFREKATRIGCFDSTEFGYWHYKQPQLSEFLKGTWGEEKSWDYRSCKRYSLSFVLPLSGRNGCQCLDSSNGPWITRRGFPLLPGHGWIDLGSDRESDGLENLPVTFYPEKGNPVLMPFQSRERGPISFHPFKSAYFIEGDYFSKVTKGNMSPWPKDIPRKAWWLEPDGKITPIVIPPAMKDKRGAWDELTPTVQGIATMSRAGEKSDYDPGNQGVYLINGNKVEKLLDGTVDRMGISPNGCRLAVSNAPNNATDHLGKYDKQFRTMKVIELCNAKH